MKGFNLNEIIVLLRRTPYVLEAILDDLPNGFIQCTEGEGTWSHFDVPAL